jgi:hypothetical protein
MPAGGGGAAQGAAYSGARREPAAISSFYGTPGPNQDLDGRYSIINPAV